MTDEDPVDVSRLNDILERVESARGPSRETIRSYCDAFEAWLSHTINEGSASPQQVAHWRASLSFLQGDLAYANGDVDEATERFQQSVKEGVLSGEVKREAQALRRLALCHEYAGRQVESIDCILRSIELAEKLGDPRTLSRSLSGLVALYDSQGAYEQALATAMELRQIAIDTDDSLLLGNSAQFASLFCGYLGRPAEGLEWVDEALRIATEGNFPVVATSARINRFWLYHLAGNSAAAIEAAEQELDVIRGLPAQNAASSYVDVAEIYLEAGNLQRAADMLELASEAAGEGLNGHLLAFYRVAADLHEAKGETETSLRMLRRYIELDSELRGHQASARLTMVERHFAAELAAKTEEIHHLRTVELVEKNDQLAALNRQKDEILNVVAHDLRNPLAAAQMLSESLMIDAEQGIAADHQDRLASIRSATSEMGATIDTLLHLQKHASPSVLAPVDEVVSHSVAWAEGPASKRQIELRADISSIGLKVDAALLRRSLDDILWVGLQSVAPGGTISVTVQPTGDGATITIAGQTVVSAPDDKALYIARRLVERMRGTITLTSSPDNTTQTATIDLRP